MQSVPGIVESHFSGLRIAVTGGAGSVGSNLIRHLLRLPVNQVRVLDTDESALFMLAEEYRREARVDIRLCDVRNGEEVDRAFVGMDIAFHCAALKHVNLCEQAPFSAVNTNILGVQAVIKAALHNGMRQVNLASSDKAVNPTNVMGATKLMGERLFTASNVWTAGKTRCVFSSTRFGNVAGSQGSVVPLFCNQILSGGAITLTDPEMTRFIMTLDEAASLLIESVALAKGGEIFITKMPMLRIADLAAVMRRIIAPLNGRKPEDVKIDIVGRRPGEKLWEELNTDEEVRNCYDMGKFLVIVPPRQSEDPDLKEYRARGANVTSVWRSDRSVPMTHQEIETFLLRPGVLPEAIYKRLV